MEEELVNNLMDLLNEKADEFFEENEIPMQITNVRTFAEGMVLTHNQGMVLTVTDEDGEEAEYQLTLVRSR